MSIYILSTMTNSVSYAFFDRVGDLPVMRKKVTIQGGAGLPSIRSGFGEVTRDGEGSPMWTASGMITPISDEQYAALKDHVLFNKHIDGGFIKVLNQDISGNHKAVEKHVQTMNKRDEFAQLTKDTLKQRIKVKGPLELEQEGGLVRL